MAAGGLPVLLPHEPDHAADYMAGLDGLMVPGGAFDIDPALFGAGSRHATVKIKERRTAFELALAKIALTQDTPVFGICGGQQLLNVALGGTLIQHIPDEIDSGIAHEQPNPRNEPGHTVTISTGTLLHRICGVEVLSVNSAHHQSVDQPGPSALVNAVAPDGIIEGIEAPRQRFFLGVQWHPEYAISAADNAIITAFVAAAANAR